MSEQVKGEIISEYLSGKSSYQIAKDYGFKCSKSVAKILRNNHIEIRSQKYSVSLKSIKFNGKEFDKILLMNADPLISLKDIASELRRDPKIIKRKLKELNLYDPLKYDKYLISKFDPIDSEEKAYWLGFLAADGCISRKQLALQLAAKDIDHLIKFKSFIGVDYKISKVTTNLDGKLFIGYRYVISSHNFVNSLAKYGLVPRKSFTLQFTDKLSNELIRHYIRGLVDGDGSFSVNKSDRLQFSLISSLEVCKEVQKHLIQNCNLNKTKLFEMCSGGGEKYYYLVYCGSAQCTRISQYLYNNSTVFLDRKRALIEAFVKNHKYQ